MEESLQHTLVLAQRTADEVKAAAHKEADLIKQEARMAAEREIIGLADRVDEARRTHQRVAEAAHQAKGELRSLLMSHLALLDRAQVIAPPPGVASVDVAPVLAEPPSTNGVVAPVSERPLVP
jgi:cell division initiation protein